MYLAQFFDPGNTLFNTSTRQRSTPNKQASIRKKKIAMLQTENAALKDEIKKLEDRYDGLEQAYTREFESTVAGSSAGSEDDTRVVDKGEKKLRKYIDQFKTIDTYNDRDLVDEILDDIRGTLMRVNTGAEMDRLCMEGQIDRLDSFARDVEDGRDTEEQVAVLEARWISTYRSLLHV